MVLSGKLSCLDLSPCGFQMGEVFAVTGTIPVCRQSAFIECLLNADH